MDVFHLEYISVRNCRSFLWSSIWKVVNVEGIADELWWVGSNVLNLLEFILRLERVARLSGSSKLVLLGL